MLVGVLNGNPTIPMLFKVSFLEITNAATVMQNVIQALHVLWPENIHFNRLKLLISDQAPYMIKAGKDLKTLFTELNHISCLAHALHRVCEKIRKENELVNEYISSVKAIFTKSPLRIQSFKQLTDIALPPEPVITRWGTFLKAAFYHLDNFDIISGFIFNLEDDSKKIRSAKKLISNENMKEQLLNLHNYRMLPKAIEKLESQSLKFQEQLDIVDEVKKSLSGSILQKLEKCLDKNPDLEKLRNSSDINLKLKLFYAPLNSAAVERSFSIFKYILNERREKLSTESIEKLLILKYNSFL